MTERGEGEWLPNNRVKLSVWSDTACANSAQAAPAQPAAYAERSADEDDADSCNQDER